ATASCAAGPTVSPANGTGCPSSSPSRRATGARLNRSSGAPSGRPRCETTTTRAPRPVSSRRVVSEARMRPAAVLVPPSSGTFRAQRTSTRLPARGRRLSLVRSIGSRALAESGDDVLRQVDEAVRVAPLVVVPAGDLDLGADDLRQTGVEDAGVR